MLSAVSPTDSPSSLDSKNKPLPHPSPGRLLRRWSLVAVPVVLIVALAAFFLGIEWGEKKEAAKSEATPSSPGKTAGNAIALKPGPWGEMECVPMTIAPPEELLPVRALEDEGTRWFFDRFTPGSLAEILRTSGVPDEIKSVMMQPDRMSESEDGVEVRPGIRVLKELPMPAREKLYRLLASGHGNRSGITFLHASDVDERFRASGVADATVAEFKRWCCVRGDYLAFSGIGEMLSTLPDYEAKVRFMKALSQQKTLLLRLHVTPESDVEALADYWGKAIWAMDVKELLTSVAAVPGGTWLDAVELLPPLPTAQLHSFPKQELVSDGVRRDCHWTAYNFFRDPPDPNFGKSAFVRQMIQENYAPVTGDPRYGDIVMFTLPDDSIIHSAVFLADDVVYTKNGDTPIHPWMLSRISDLIAQYSFMVEPGQQLKVSYLRNKYL